MARVLGQVDSGGRVLGQVQPETQPKPTGSLLSDFRNIKETGADIKETGQAIFGQFKESGEKIVDIAKDKDLGIGGKILGIGSEAFRGGSRALGEGVLGLGKVALTQEGEEKFGEKVEEVVTDIASNKQVQSLAKKYKALSPETKRNVDNALGFAEGLADILAPGVASKITKTTFKAIEESVIQAGKGAVVTKKVIKDVAQRKDVRKSKVLAREIIQGKEKDIPVAQRALAKVDTTDVKNYTQLNTKISEKVGTLAKQQDELLDTASDITYLPDSLVVTKKVGDKTVPQNFVQDALVHLDELYKKVNDPVAAERIKQLAQKMQNEGLTIREINDLAREHGLEVANKGFSKVSGEPLTSVNAVAFENTRSGLKKTARDLFKNKDFDNLDFAMSDLIRARKLSERMIEEVNKAKRVIKTRKFGEKVGRALFQVIDILTGSTLSGFLRAGLVPRGGGLKTLSALDLEKRLNKNLKELQKITDKNLPEAETLTVLQSILKSLQESKALPTSQSTKTTVNTTPQNPIGKILPQSTPQVKKK